MSLAVEYVFGNLVPSIPIALSKLVEYKPIDFAFSFIIFTKFGIEPPISFAITLAEFASE